MSNEIYALILAAYLVSNAAPARSVVTGSTLGCLAGKVYHTKSDRNGSFKVEIPASERLIVFSYMETEDNPHYSMHTDVNVNHQSTLFVILDYCKSR
jgi:hypothetical protein